MMELDPKDKDTQAQVLVGRFLWHFAVLEGTINDCIGKALRLETLEKYPTNALLAPGTGSGLFRLPQLNPSSQTANPQANDEMTEAAPPSTGLPKNQ